MNVYFFEFTKYLDKDFQSISGIKRKRQFGLVN